MLEDKTVFDDTTEALTEVEATEPVEPTDDLLPEDLAYQMPFEEFLRINKSHRGLVASFKVEAEHLDPRSQTAWEEAFKVQAKRVYK